MKNIRKAFETNQMEKTFFFYKDTVNPFKYYYSEQEY
jgi:hypothetical protein